MQRETGLSCTYLAHHELESVLIIIVEAAVPYAELSHAAAIVLP